MTRRCQIVADRSRRRASDGRARTTFQETPMTDFAALYAERLTTPEAAAALIPSGAKVASRGAVAPVPS